MLQNRIEIINYIMCIIYMYMYLYIEWDWDQSVDPSLSKTLPIVQSSLK